jgi:hypothetical protein
MNLKSELTLKLAQIQGLDIDEKSLKKHQKLWWVNFRDKSVGGLKLTELGFSQMEKAEIKGHKIKIQKPLEYTNQNLIELDRYIDCPWYIYRNYIYVYGDKMAVQLVLFSGDLKRFVEAKRDFRKLSKNNP